ncbi:MAG: PHP domain-containing protein [Eubacteriales bacterium]
MDEKIKLLIQSLNAPSRDERLSALSAIKRLTDTGTLPTPAPSGNVNNHIHTTYSFSPYSPTKALYMAWQNGLETAGIMDHDSLGGAREFIEAGKIIGMSTTVGLECRADMSRTALAGRRINNPDQKENAYVAMHGIAHPYIEQVNGFFAPFRTARGRRNVKMCENISELCRPAGIELDYECDVVPLSMWHDSGSVTERHIMYGLAKKIADKYPTPEGVISFLETGLGISLSEKQRKTLSAQEEGYYLYDILGILKAELVQKIFVEATDECPDITDYIKLCRISGAISAYAYLGDISDSVTGDKKAQSFEDMYIDLLFAVLKSLGFNAVTYMPTRNSLSQLQRVMIMCEENGFFQISGEDINSPRQSFICKALENPAFSHLVRSTWALIGHEKLASEDINKSMFSKKVCEMYPDMQKRIDYFSTAGKM